MGSLDVRVGMHSSVDLIAESRGPGATVLRRARAGGHFAVRQTAPGVVHLVGTAAGPIGGDEVLVQIHVGAGARLSVLSAAATIVLPGRVEALSALRVEAIVEDGGTLEIAMQPTVVCAGAEHHATFHATLFAEARLRLREQLVLGRAGEPPGTWRGRLSVVRDDRPVLRHTVRSQTLGLPGDRALVSELVIGPADEQQQGPTSAGGSVVMPLAAGGLLGTAIGADLVTARADLDRALAAERVPLAAG